MFNISTEFMTDSFYVYRDKIKYLWSILAPEVLDTITATFISETANQNTTSPNCYHVYNITWSPVPHLKNGSNAILGYEIHWRKEPVFIGHQLVTGAQDVGSVRLSPVNIRI